MRLKKKSVTVTYDDRYKHKLNMLWPRQTMIRIVGVLVLMGIPFRLLKWQTIASVAFILAGVILTILLISVAVELHQDKGLNEIAMRDNEEREKHGDCW